MARGCGLQRVSGAMAAAAGGQEEPIRDSELNDFAPGSTERPLPHLARWELFTSLDILVVLQVPVQYKVLEQGRVGSSRSWVSGVAAAARRRRHQQQHAIRPPARYA